MTNLDDVLADFGLTGQEDRVRAALRKDTAPWFLQPFIFLGAMVAALMFSAAFLVMLDSMFDVNRFSTVQLSCMGAVYLVAAVFLNRLQLNIYTGALALALSLGGHGFVMGAVGEATKSSAWFMTTFLVLLVLDAGLYFLYRDGLHRFLTTVLVLVLAKLAFAKEHLDFALHGLVLVTTLVGAGVLTRDRELPGWRPLAYGCCTGLVVVLFPVGHRHDSWFDFTRHAMAYPWISSVLVGIALLWTLHWASRKPIPPTAKTVAVLVTGGLAALSTPGLAAALFLTVLGHAAYHARITLLGLVSLPVFLWKYYYYLDLSFLHKSGVLAGSGVLLLGTRWILGYLEKKEAR